MKKIIATFLVAASIAVCAEAKKSESKNSDSTISEQEISEALNKAGEGIKKGADKAGEGIKSFFGKAKEKATEENKEKAKEKASEIGQKVGDKVKAGAEKTKEAINSHSTKILTGVLNVKGKGKKAVMNFKAEDGNTYTLKTISGSEDSKLKLSAYNKKKIKISGILNTDTNEITLTTYSLAKDGNEDDDE